ncbi:MAG: HlyD family efflux transporter periplasmic adaptor subunit [Microvirga sp.]|nr:HlyD family efflux transporter periplasmic adaptor subunit [Microvirga sp.]
MNARPDRGLLALGAVLEIEKRARAALTVEELGFLVVNDTHLVAPYRQAAFYRADRRVVQALSGLAMPDPDAPFTRLLRTWFERSRAEASEQPGAAWALPTGALAEFLGAPDSEARREAEQNFAAHLPDHALRLALRFRGEETGALLFARETPFAPAEIALLEHLADAYAHALVALTGKGARSLRRTRRAIVVGGCAALATLLALLPVRQSVLAPAEIVAENATLVRAPAPGVVETVHVRPNEAAAAGAPLLSLDGRELATRREVARQQLAVAEAELRQARQQAVFDERSRAQLAILQGRREQHVAEVAFVEGLLARIDVAAPRAGVAIFDDAADWEGRPVALGERIMLLADPDDRALEIRLAVPDAIVLEPGASVDLFLNIDPADPIPARLTRAGYRASATPEGVMAYRLRAAFTAEDSRLRIGLRGTAKIYGEETRLIVYLLRRPIAGARLWLGL